jgi:hypothetical protein
MLEDLKPSPRSNRSCRIRTILDELSESDRAIFSKALGDLDAYPHIYLARAMTERGILLSDKSVTNHRKGVCSCLKA